MPQRFEDADALVDAVIAAVGPRLIVALPLGLGKANHFANALYGRAKRDPSLSLTIHTGLSLDVPSGGGDIAERFAGPLADRLYDGVTRLDYVADRKRGTLPDNVRVVEFFLQAGTLISNDHAQRNYVSANYTHAADFILASGVNVVGQMVAPDTERERYSLSCNTDMTLDMMPVLERARSAPDAGRLVMVGEANAALPFMGGDAVLPADRFDFLLEGEAVEGARLFSVPKRPVRLSEHAIGLYCAALIPDGGTLQIGIGGIGDGLVNALLLRHRRPETFRACLDALGGWPAGLTRHTDPFVTGLYGLSEMLVEGFLDLMAAGILKRPAGDGALIHAGFFLGSQDFYARLRALAPGDRDRIAMRGIRFVNDAPGDPATARDRAGARFVNAAMVASVLGDVSSDQLPDGRVVSGVGGQYNFVAQAFALPGARAIIALPATREAGRASNIRFSCAHTTIPRHLKDVIVTQYGVADLRGATDRDTVAAMVGLADARFQAALVRDAVGAHKIERSFRPARRNTDRGLAAAIAPYREHLPAYPFGSDLTPVERRLVPALDHLKARRGDRLALARLAWRGFRAPPTLDECEAIDRMDLTRPRTVRQRLLAAVLRGALVATRGEAG